MFAFDAIARGDFMLLRSSALDPLLMVQTSVWGIPEEYDLAEIVPRGWRAPGTRGKTSTPNFPALDRGANGGMLCNTSASLFESLQPGLIQNLHLPLITALKKSAPALWAGALDEAAPVAI
jgi:hypothetical protein